ncbi:hypothetical protein [Bosea sp. BIWAKO-01]|uniref:hypothetical protein n=1 Tax=Bosea sp. BIWAKO-01 TaxID=506668 RepID=UPI000869DE90|nr:hypothetical protein [Bosea sp. BIWAKO-01]GAU87032.1 hypothetical protein BIWAKO_06985 [Bosea sp. BIWAKO-01]
MHMVPIVAAVSALALSGAASAQAPPGDFTADREIALNPGAPSGPLKNRSVIVVDIGALPKAERLRVNQIVAARGESELEKLRTAIDAAPTLIFALRLQGLSSLHVLIAETGAYGRLTLITKKKI